MKTAKLLQYPTENMTGPDYPDDLALLSTIQDLAEFLWHCSRGISLYLNINKPDFIIFKQKVTLFTLSEKPLKLVDPLIHLGNNISSTEKDISTGLSKERNVIDRLSVIWKPDL